MLQSPVTSKFVGCTCTAFVIQAITISSLGLNI